MSKATFTNTAAARSVMAHVHAQGLVSAWNDQNVFGKTYVRFQRDGRWFDLLASDLTAWGL